MDNGLDMVNEYQWWLTVLILLKMMVSNWCRWWSWSWQRLRLTMLNRDLQSPGYLQTVCFWRRAVWKRLHVAMVQRWFMNHCQSWLSNGYGSNMVIQWFKTWLTLESNMFCPDTWMTTKSDCHELQMQLSRYDGWILLWVNIKPPIMGHSNQQQ